ncbi:MAG: polysaccharide deacetylase family protein [Candidatus Gracilibacteria bacterium]|nr:polysaccharide deacetylase family protein [Candidatus Gracilibacteria bacterium]
MSLKTLYIFLIAVTVIMGVSSLYHFSGGVSSSENSAILIKNTQAMSEKTGLIHGFSGQCIQKIDDLKVYAYMFHYVIPEKYVRKDNKIEYGNTISPEKLESILISLSKSRDAGKIKITSLSELADYRKNNCFPNKNIVLLTVDDGWDDGYNFLFPLAKKYDMKFNLTIIADKVSTTPSETHNFLNEREIQEMLDSGLITLASHSFSHIELHKQTEEVLRKELSLSKNALEKWFHITVNTIVYPSGKYDTFTVQKAKEYGYTFGFTTKNGIISKEDLDKNPLTLPRIRVNRDTDIAKTFLFEER